MPAEFMKQGHGKAHSHGQPEKMAKIEIAGVALRRDSKRCTRNPLDIEVPSPYAGALIANHFTDTPKQRQGWIAVFQNAWRI
jgi:hypothetical protein